MDKSFIRENIIFWSRLGFGLDPIILDDDGLPVIYDKTFSQLKTHQNFYEKGIKIHSFILNSGWIGDGKYDYTVTDMTMDKACEIGEDAKLLPRIKLNVPIDWCRNHPEEVFVYPGGPSDAESIRNMVGTSDHDYYGYEAPDGIYMGDPKYRRKNVNGKICLQSFSSDKWLEDAGAALQKLIAHLEEKYPDRIIGYHIAYGTSGETIMWGRISGRYGDYGITNRRKFSEFLREKYGIDAPIPTPVERYSQMDTLSRFMRADNKISRYYDEFTDEMNSRAIEYFCKAVKEIAPERLTGIFYGYFMGVQNIAYTGHTELEKLLSSPYVDFFAAPKTYYRSGPGDSCAEFGVTQSVNLSKVWVDECDIRTHLAAADTPPEWRNNDIHQTENCLTRELAKNMSHNSGFWFMDLGGMWYSSDEMMELVGRLNRINEQVRKKPYASVSDVLLLVDEKSVSTTSISMDCLKSYVTDFICNTKMSGVVLDVHRQKDIYSLDLSKYKLVIFAYTFRNCASDLEYIKSKTDAAIMFNYAAGCLEGGDFSLENTKSLSGFTLSEKEVSEYDFPALEILDRDNVIRADKHGEVVYKEVDGRLHIMNTVPYLDVDSIRKITTLCGCHNYCDANYTLYADSRFIALTAGAEPFCGKLRLPETKKWRNMKTGECGEASEIALNMKPYDTAVFIF